MDDVEDNEYLQMCKSKRGRNEKFLNQVVNDLKKGKRDNEIKTPSKKKKGADKKTNSPKSPVRKESLKKGSPKSPVRIDTLKKGNSVKKSKTRSPKRIFAEKNSSSPKTNVRKPRKNFKPKKVIVTKAVDKKCTHKLYISYEQETDRRYCKKGMDLEGGSCSKCKLKFGMPGMPPSDTQPMWVCCNRKYIGCTYSLCSDCYFEMQNGSSNRRTRR
jgi:hypothetical protein